QCREDLVEEGPWLRPGSTEDDEETASEKGRETVEFGSEAQDARPAGSRADSTKSVGAAVAARLQAPRRGSFAGPGGTRGIQETSPESRLGRRDADQNASEGRGAEAWARGNEADRGVSGSVDLHHRTAGCAVSKELQKQSLHVHRLPKLENLPVPPSKPLDTLEDLFMLPSGNVPLLSSPSTVFPVSFACGFPLAPSASLVVPEFPPTFQLAFSPNKPLPAELPCGPHPVLGAGLLALGAPGLGEGSYLFQLPSREAFSAPRKTEKPRKKKDAADDERRTKKARDSIVASLVSSPPPGAGSSGQGLSSTGGSASGLGGDNRKKRGRKSGRPVGEKTGAASSPLPTGPDAGGDRTGEEEEAKGISVPEGFREPSRSPEREELPGSDEENENEDGEEQKEDAHACAEAQDGVRPPGILPKWTHIMPAVENSQDFLRAIECIYGGAKRKRRREDSSENERKPKTTRAGRPELEAVSNLTGKNTTGKEQTEENQRERLQGETDRSETGVTEEGMSNCQTCGEDEAGASLASRRSSLSSCDDASLQEDPWTSLSLFEDCCALCGSAADPQSLYHCPSCGESFHGQCIGVAPSLSSSRGVQCPRCAVCVVCDGRAPCMHLEDVRNRRTAPDSAGKVVTASSGAAGGLPAFSVAQGLEPQSKECRDLPASSTLSPKAEALRQQFHVYRCGGCGVCAHSDCVWQSGVEIPRVSSLAPSAIASGSLGLPTNIDALLLKNGNLRPQFRPQIPHPWSAATSLSSALPSFQSSGPSPVSVGASLVGASPSLRATGSARPEGSGGAAVFAGGARPASSPHATLPHASLPARVDQEKLGAVAASQAHEALGAEYPLQNRRAGKSLEGAGVRHAQASSSHFSLSSELSAATGSTPGGRRPAGTWLPARTQQPDLRTASDAVRPALLSQLSHFMRCLKLLVRRLGWRPTAIAPLLGSTPETLHRMLLQLKLSPSSFGEEGQNVLQWCFFKAVEAKQRLPGFEGVRLPLPSDFQSPPPTLADILPQLAALRQSGAFSGSSHSSAASASASSSLASSVSSAPVASAGGAAAASAVTHSSSVPAVSASPSSVASAAPGGVQPHLSPPLTTHAVASSLGSLSSLPLQSSALNLRPGALTHRPQSGAGASSGVAGPRGDTTASHHLTASLPPPSASPSAAATASAGLESTASDLRGLVTAEQLLLGHRLLHSSLASSLASAGTPVSSEQAALLLQHLRESYREKQRAAPQQVKGLAAAASPREAAAPAPQATLESAGSSACLSFSSSDGAYRGRGEGQSRRPAETPCRQEDSRGRPASVAIRESRERSPRGSYSDQKISQPKAGRPSSLRGAGQEEAPERGSRLEDACREAGAGRRQQGSDSSGTAGVGSEREGPEASVSEGRNSADKRMSPGGEAVGNTKLEGDREPAAVECTNRFDTSSSSVYPEAEVLSQLLSNCFPDSISSSLAFPDDPEELGCEDGTKDEEQRRRRREIRQEQLHQAAFWGLPDASPCSHDSQTDEDPGADDLHARQTRRGDGKSPRHHFLAPQDAHRGERHPVRDSSLAPSVSADVEEGRRTTRRLIREDCMHRSAPPPTPATSNPTAASSAVPSPESATPAAAARPATERPASAPPQADESSAALRALSSSLLSSVTAGDVHNLLFSSSGLALMTPEQQRAVLRALQRHLGANASRGTQVSGSLGASAHLQAPQAAHSLAPAAPRFNAAPAGGDCRPGGRGESGKPPDVAGLQTPQPESERLRRAALQGTHMGTSSAEQGQVGTDPTSPVALLQALQQLRTAAFQSSSPSAPLQERIQALLQLQQNMQGGPEGSPSAVLQSSLFPRPASPIPSASASLGLATTGGEGGPTLPGFAFGGALTQSKKRQRSAAVESNKGAGGSEPGTSLSSMHATSAELPAPGGSPTFGSCAPRLSPTAAKAPGSRGEQQAGGATTSATTSAATSAGQRESGSRRGPAGSPRHTAGGPGASAPHAGPVHASTMMPNSAFLSSNCVPSVQMKPGNPGGAVPSNAPGPSPSSLRPHVRAALVHQFPSLTSLSHPPGSEPQQRLQAGSEGVPDGLSPEVRGLPRELLATLGPKPAGNVTQPLPLRPTPPASHPGCHSSPTALSSGLSRARPNPAGSLGVSASPAQDAASLFVQQAKAGAMALMPGAGRAVIADLSGVGTKGGTHPRPAPVSASATHAPPPLKLQRISQVPYLPSQQAALTASSPFALPAGTRQGGRPSEQTLGGLGATSAPEPGRPGQRHAGAVSVRGVYPTALFLSGSSPEGAGSLGSSLGEECLVQERLGRARSRTGGLNRDTGFPDAAREFHLSLTEPYRRGPEVGVYAPLTSSPHAASPVASVPPLGAGPEATLGGGWNLLGRQGPAWHTDWAYPGTYVGKAPPDASVGGEKGDEEERGRDRDATQAEGLPPLLFCGDCWRRETCKRKGERRHGVRDPEDQLGILQRTAFLPQQLLLLPASGSSYEAERAGGRAAAQGDVESHPDAAEAGKRTSDRETKALETHGGTGACLRSRPEERDPDVVVKCGFCGRLEGLATVGASSESSSVPGPVLASLRAAARCAAGAFCLADASNSPVSLEETAAAADDPASASEPSSSSSCSASCESVGGDRSVGKKEALGVTPCRQRDETSEGREEGTQVEKTGRKRPLLLLNGLQGVCAKCGPTNSCEGEGMSPRTELGTCALGKRESAGNGKGGADRERKKREGSRQDKENGAEERNDISPFYLISLFQILRTVLTAILDVRPRVDRAGAPLSPSDRERGGAAPPAEAVTIFAWMLVDAAVLPDEEKEEETAKDATKVPRDESGKGVSEAALVSSMELRNISRSVVSWLSEQPAWSREVQAVLGRFVQKCEPEQEVEKKDDSQKRLEALVTSVFKAFAAFVPAFPESLALSKNDGVSAPGSAAEGQATKRDAENRRVGGRLVMSGQPPQSTSVEANKQTSLASLPFFSSSFVGASCLPPSLGVNAVSSSVLAQACIAPGSPSVRAGFRNAFLPPGGEEGRRRTVLEYGLRCNLWVLLELGLRKYFTQGSPLSFNPHMPSWPPVSPDAPSLLVRLVAQRLRLGDDLRPTTQPLSSSLASSLLTCELCGENGDRLVRGRLLPFGHGLSLHSECIAWSVDPALLPSLANPRLALGVVSSAAGLQDAQEPRGAHARRSGEPLGDACVTHAAETVPVHALEAEKEDGEERALKRPKTTPIGVGAAASGGTHTPDVVETAGPCGPSPAVFRMPTSVEPFLELPVCLPPIEIPSEEVTEVVADAAVSRCVWCSKLGASVYCSAPECSVKLHLACAFAAATDPRAAACGTGEALEEGEPVGLQRGREGGEETRRRDREDFQVRLPREERELSETRNRAFPIHVVFSRRQIWCHACWKSFPCRPGVAQRWFDPLFVALEGLSGSVCFIVARQLSQSIRLRPPCVRLRDLPTAEQESSATVAAALLPFSGFFSLLPPPQTLAPTPPSFPTKPCHLFSFTAIYGNVESLLAPLLAFLVSSSSLLLPASSSPSSSLAAVWSQKVALYTKQKNLVAALAPFLLRSPSLLGALVASVDSRQVLRRLGKRTACLDLPERPGAKGLRRHLGRGQVEAPTHGDLQRPSDLANASTQDALVDACLSACLGSGWSDEEVFQLRQQTLPQGDFWLGGRPCAAVGNSTHMDALSQHRRDDVAGSSRAAQPLIDGRARQAWNSARERPEKVPERDAVSRADVGSDGVAGTEDAHEERHNGVEESFDALNVEAENDFKRAEPLAHSGGDAKEKAQAFGTSRQPGPAHSATAHDLSSSLFSDASLKRLSAALAATSPLTSTSASSLSSTLSPASPLSPASLPRFAVEEKRHHVIRHGALTVLNVGTPLSYDGGTCVFPIGFVSVRRFPLPPCLQTAERCWRRAAARPRVGSASSSSLQAEKKHPEERRSSEAQRRPTRGSYVCSISLRDGQPFFTIDILASSFGRRRMCACIFAWLPSSCRGEAHAERAILQPPDGEGEGAARAIVLDAKNGEKEMSELRISSGANNRELDATMGDSPLSTGIRRSQDAEVPVESQRHSSLERQVDKDTKRQDAEKDCAPVWGWRLAEGADLEETFARFLSLFHLRRPAHVEQALRGKGLENKATIPEGEENELRAAAKRKREAEPDERSHKKLGVSQETERNASEAGEAEAPAVREFSISGYTFFGINSPYVVERIKPKVFDVLAWRALSRLGDAHHNRLGVLIGNCHRMEQWERRWPKAAPPAQSRAGGRQREMAGEPQLGVPRDLLTHPLDEDTKAENLDELMVCSFNRISEKTGEPLAHADSSALLASGVAPSLSSSGFASASSSPALPLFPASSSRSVSVLSRAKAKRQFDQLPPSMQYRYLQSVGVDDRLSVRSSTIHGQGLFANVPLAEGEPVIEYVGDMVRNCVSDLREALYEKQGGGGDGACYMFRLDDNFVVDATRAGNVSRFINHSCEPNCTCRILVCEAGQKHIVIIAKTAIRAGEEITYDYQFGIGNETDKLACLCGARSCLGRMN
ncbi:histone lysine methyltransferase SET1, partial [Toxoplasma gondii RUB]